MLKVRKNRTHIKVGPGILTILMAIAIIACYLCGRFLNIRTVNYVIMGMVLSHAINMAGYYVGRRKRKKEQNNLPPEFNP